MIPSYHLINGNFTKLVSLKLHECVSIELQLLITNAVVSVECKSDKKKIIVGTKRTAIRRISR